MAITVLCYAKCTTCQKALRWLDEQGVAYAVRPVKEENPSAEELTQWQARSGLPLKRFFNTSGTLYRSLGLKDRLDGMSGEEQLALLASDGMLMKRPLLVTEGAACPGFREEAWKKAIGEER